MDIKNNPKYQLLKFKFNKTYIICIKENRADYNLFVSMVDNLLDAIKESETLKNPILKVAFNNYYEKCEKEIADLEASLKARKMI